MQPPKPSWASTLRLPRSAFPPRALLADRQEYLKRCSDDLYAWQRTAPSAKPTFTLHDGPPYANGSLHIGHALNKILKDITCRVQVSHGRRVNYVPGWDCHGLPIELKALQRQKEKGQIDNASQLGAVSVRRAARQLAQDTVEEQKAGFRQWAVMGDWDNAWKSMDKDFEIRQLKVFKSMVDQGFIYLKNKPVYWSPSSKTALAEAELEYNPEHESMAAFVKFSLVKLPSGLEAIAGGEQVSAVIWTTTPWTLLANKAIAVHKDLQYALVRSQKHGILVVGQDRIEDMSKSCSENFSESVLATITGSSLLTGRYAHPLVGSSPGGQPIFHGDFVSAGSGSGLVHVAPGHGMDDYKLCLENGIEPFAPVDNHGKFTAEAFPSDPELFTGKEVLKDGNSATLDLLQGKGALIASNKYKHNYPYDWRSKQPVIIRATEQWFADVGQIRETTLKSLNGVFFVPTGGKERLSSFIRTRSEWCVSRQRAWGVPIPALYSKASSEVVMDSASVKHIINVIQERGINAWWTDAEFDSAWVPRSLRDSEYRRGRDTMDVWFDSGTSWTHMSKDPNNESQVADLYIEGTDQHRGWFQSSLLTKIAFQAAAKTATTDAPFKTLITHGFTLDQDGKKMSKSLGNVISPDEIMQGTLLPPIKPKKVKGQNTQNQPVKYDGMGADALRLWVAGCDYTRDVVVGKPALAAVNQSLSKLRVTLKLLTGLLDTHSHDRSTSFSYLNFNDQMALLALRDLEKIVKSSYAAYEYHRVVAAINQYINADFSAVYVESIKDRMYADATCSPSRIDAQIVLWEIFKRLTHMLAPITPLLVEEACDFLPEQLRWFHPVRAAWEPESTPSIAGHWENKWLEQNMPVLNAVNTAVKTAQEQARADKKMGSSLQSFVALSLSGGHPLLDYQGDLGEGRNYIPFMLGDLFVVSRVDLYEGLHSRSRNTGAWAYTAECETLGHKAVTTVYEPSLNKCVRCWKYDADEDVEEDICQRCVGVVAGLDGAAEELFKGKENLKDMAKGFRMGSASRILQRHWDMEYKD